MDTIDNMVNRRLDDTFGNYPDTKEMHELREELAADLSEAAHDNAKGGATLTDAVNHAFDGLGDLDDLVDEINAGAAESKSTDDTDADEKQSDNTHTNTHDYHHGHHIDIADGKVVIDGGKILRIDEDGIKINDGKAVNIDNNGININNGTFTVTDEGIRMGNLVIDDHGIHTNHGPSTQPNDKRKTATHGYDAHSNDKTFANFDNQFNAQEPVDTEIYVDSLALANEQQFNTSSIQRINMDYTDGNVKILTNPDDDHIIFREYMNRSNSSYLAQTQVDHGTLLIRNGNRPHLLPLRIRTQLLIPAAFTGDLLLNAASGTVMMDNASHLNQVRLVVNSGSLHVNKGQFNDLDIAATSGSVSIAQTAVTGLLRSRVHSGSVRLSDTTVGKFDVDAKSGSIRGTDITGSGAFNATSGSINLDFAGLNGNLDTTAKSSSIRLAFAANIEYNFDLDATSGNITGPENAIYDHNTTSFKDGAVGDDPHFYVTAVTKSSSIRVS